MLVYKTRCSLNLNVPSTLTTLPNSPRKKSEIMRGLAKFVGLQLERCLQKELDSETKWKYEIVKQFFLEKDIVYTAPGLRTMSLYMKVEKNNDHVLEGSIQCFQDKISWN